jgi:HAMP domain-containing protein
MLDYLKNLRLNVKVALLGAISVLITAIALVSLAMWQSGQYNILSQSEVDKLIAADLDHITQGVYNLVKTQDKAAQNQVDYNLVIAHYILSQAGKIRLSSETVEWVATNQFTKKQIRMKLPRLFLGDKSFDANINSSLNSNVVDKIINLIGGTISIFQCMNPKGDMLRISTNVKTSVNKRAIGTYLPALFPDGQPNPVIETILAGKKYHGRAYVVNSWYLTAYEPLKDNFGNVIGMLNVGVQQKSVESLIRQAILKTKVGNTGYVYIIGGKGEDRGHYIISQNGERDGEDIWVNKDIDNQYMIQNIINKALSLKPGDLATERYRWQNPGEPKARWKIARLAYYAPWDWVIGTSVYEDELQYYQTILKGGQLRMSTIMGIAGIIMIIIVSLISVGLAYTIASPFRQMTKAVETIAQGNFEQLVEIQSNDEVGALPGLSI